MPVTAHQNLQLPQDAGPLPSASASLGGALAQKGNMPLGAPDTKSRFGNIMAITKAVSQPSPMA